MARSKCSHSECDALVLSLSLQKWGGGNTNYGRSLCDGRLCYRVYPIVPRFPNVFIHCGETRRCRLGEQRSLGSCFFGSFLPSEWRQNTTAKRKVRDDEMRLRQKTVSTSLGDTTVVQQLFHLSGEEYIFRTPSVRSYTLRCSASLSTLYASLASLNCSAASCAIKHAKRRKNIKQGFLKGGKI